MAVETGQFTHTLEQIDEAVTDVTNAKGQSASLSDAITAAAESVVSDLDVTEVGGSGKYISAIKEVDGKIIATPETMDTTPTNGSKKAITSEAVYTAMAGKASISDVYGVGTAIESGTDLNNLTTAGLYTCATVTIANTLINTPITGSAFRLEVKYLNNSTRIRQECYILSDTSSYYARTYTSTGWKTWYLFTGTAVTPPASQTNLNPSAQLQSTPSDLSEPDLGENGDEMR